MAKVSYFVVDNLNCPIFILSEKSPLSDELNIPATNVNVSLVSQTVTVRHNESVTPASISHALEKVGFNVEVEDNDTEAHTHGTGTGSSSSSWFPNPLAGRKRKRLHREICKSCQAEERAKTDKKTIVSRTSFSSFSRSFRSSK